MARASARALATAASTGSGLATCGGCHHRHHRCDPRMAHVRATCPEEACSLTNLCDRTRPTTQPPTALAVTSSTSWMPAGAGGVLSTAPSTELSCARVTGEAAGATAPGPAATAGARSRSTCGWFQVRSKKVRPKATARAAAHLHLRPPSTPHAQARAGQAHGKLMTPTHLGGRAGAHNGVGQARQRQGGLQTAEGLVGLGG